MNIPETCHAQLMQYIHSIGHCY